MKRFLALVGLLALGASACGQASRSAGAGEEVPEPAQEQALDAGDISLASSIWQINAHHRVATELASAGDFNGAIVHTRHPIDELMTPIREGLAEQGGPDGAAFVERLDSSTAAAAAAAVDENEDGIEKSVDDAVQAINDAVDALPQGTTDAFTGSVIADLLATSGHEYEEAVAGEGGGIHLTAEYQDAYGMMSVARALYADRLAAIIEAQAPEEAEEIEEGWEKLEEALPGATPPKKSAGAEEVEAAASLIAHELEETVGAQVSEEVETAEVWGNIDSLLGEIQTAYEEGETAEAAELAAVAYLENYELVEAQVIEKAPEVNAELEPLLGAELRAKITEGAPASEIADIIAQARSLLKQAQEAVGEEES